MPGYSQVFSVDLLPTEPQASFR
uniref:Uncharacterized protein n=1 Tax=Anguilla anguilla TaxID=7936 RepID=A0A0E9R426_ANGAN